MIIKYYIFIFVYLQRLRLRGDWSDTGPNARPEGNQQANNPFSNDDETASASESQEASSSQSQSMVSSLLDCSKCIL